MIHRIRDSLEEDADGVRRSQPMLSHNEMEYCIDHLATRLEAAERTILQLRTSGARVDIKVNADHGLPPIPSVETPSAFQRFMSRLGFGRRA